jgi:acyl carrier protein
MSQVDVFEKVKQIIVKLDDLLDPSIIVPSASFANDLGAESLDLVEFVMALEEDFNVEIPDEAAEKLLTVKDVVDYINNYGVASSN